MSALTSEAVYEHLLKKITSGEYPPGMRVVEQNLADEMEVAPLAIHDAIRRLTEEDLVEQITGQGAFVRELKARDIIKLYTFREQLEVFAVSEAADNIQAHQQRNLEAHCEAQEKLAEALAQSDTAQPDKKLIHEWHTQDMAFHRAIVEATDNEWIQHAVERTRLLAHASRCKPRDQMPEDPALTVEEHREITAAIGSGDAFLGGDIMSRHIRRSMDSLLRRLNSNGA
ncbi:MAG: GntR family transcriptional regulator [Candidatus Hydrogenedentes bacterium]|nr:GntR family transcriptional regulator [Candidatus Hydrogenedentota bacterium]